MKMGEKYTNYVLEESKIRFLRFEGRRKGGTRGTCNEQETK